MSVQALSWVFDHSNSRLADRHVLLSIANHAHADGTNAYPSISRIASESRISESQVHRSLKRLATSGELTVEVAASPYGTNLYCLPLMGGGAKLAPVPNPPNRGVISKPKGCQIGQKTPADLAPEPYLKQTKKQTKQNKPQTEIEKPSVKPDFADPEEPEKQEQKQNPEYSAREVLKMCRSRFRAKNGRTFSQSTVRGRYGEKWLEAIDRHGGDLLFRAFEIWLEGPGSDDFAKKSRFPLALFMKDLDDWIDEAQVEPEKEVDFDAKMRDPRDVVTPKIRKLAEDMKRQRMENIASGESEKPRANYNQKLTEKQHAYIFDCYRQGKVPDAADLEQAGK